MRVKNKKDGSRTFIYSGDLEKEISKALKQVVWTNVKYLDTK
ncbi:hypothetical protein P7D17_10945 [Lactococcus petauri]|uniref:Uncharacterized protein n=1 Tax=Lactococcus petauri TaxID=1940789 RepID=A0AAJ2IWF5_9LACT|nr:hypothetical protein [Lactococcus petauri]MDT2584599.1 hypothetical protein [Lactococcus petauri]